MTDQTFIDNSSAVKDIYHRLRGLSFFASLNDEQLLSCAPYFSLAKYKEGRAITGGDFSTRQVFILCFGEASMQGLDHGGKLTVLQTLNCGDLFGDWSANDALGQTCTVIAETACLALTIDTPRFMDLLEQYPALALKQMQALREQLRAMSQMITGFLSLKAAQRVQAVLLDYAKVTQEGLWIERLPPQTKLAMQAYTQREVVVKEFNRLLKLGVLQKFSSAVLISKPEALEVRC
jgi:CRP/FNR family transcriptional regulator, cyclic AMP receptor protein